MLVVADVMQILDDEAVDMIEHRKRLFSELRTRARNTGLTWLREDLDWLVLSECILPYDIPDFG